MPGKREQEVLAAWGEPAEKIAEGIRRLEITSRALSSNRPRLIDKHPEEWVALCDSTQITGATLDKVLKKIDRRGIPRQHAIVRFINTSPKTLIL